MTEKSYPRLENGVIQYGPPPAPPKPEPQAESKPAPKKRKADQGASE